MEYIGLISQIIIALSIFNVWLLRYGQSTAYRGGNATNMKEEFTVYGLPAWSVSVVGFLKLTLAVLLLVGIYFPVTVAPAAIGMAVLMAGAMIMHIKVRDPFMKSMPALGLFVLSALALIF